MEKELERVEDETLKEKLKEKEHEAEGTLISVNISDDKTTAWATYEIDAVKLKITRTDQYKKSRAGFWINEYRSKYVVELSIFEKRVTFTAASIDDALAQLARVLRAFYR